MKKSSIVLLIFALLLLTGCGSKDIMAEKDIVAEINFDNETSVNNIVQEEKAINESKEDDSYIVTCENVQYSTDLISSINLVAKGLDYGLEEIESYEEFLNHKNGRYFENDDKKVKISIIYDEECVLDGTISLPEAFAEYYSLYLCNAFFDDDSRDVYVVLSTVASNIDADPSKHCTTLLYIPNGNLEETICYMYDEPYYFAQCMRVNDQIIFSGLEDDNILIINSKGETYRANTCSMFAKDELGTDKDVYWLTLTNVDEDGLIFLGYLGDSADELFDEVYFRLSADLSWARYENN